MTTAAARRMVLMGLLDYAAARTEAWHEAAARTKQPDAPAIAAAWDETRERLLQAIAKHDRDNRQENAA